jgi:hypothetical protein
LTQTFGSLKKSLSDQDNPSKEVPLHWAVLKNNFKISERLVAEHRRIAELFEERDEENSQGSLGQGGLYRGILEIENINQ